MSGDPGPKGNRVLKELCLPNSGTDHVDLGVVILRIGWKEKESLSTGGVTLGIAIQRLPVIEGHDYFSPVGSHGFYKFLFTRINFFPAKILYKEDGLQLV